MAKMNNRADWEKFNQFKVAESIYLLSRQLSASWQLARQQVLPASYRRFSQVVFCGMGGSNLVSELIRSVYGASIKAPFVLVRNYQLPAFVNQQTLVIICSYSGNTEETLSCFKQALSRKAKLVCLATGGQLKSWALKKQQPFYQLDNKLNPSGQPRYGVGLQLGALLALFESLRLLTISQAELDRIVEHLEGLNNLFGLDLVIKNNPAKRIARELAGRLPVIVAADNLAANAHILTNQLNESAKNLAWYNLLPELNHHLLEGLELPVSISRRLKFLFLTSNLSLLENQKRVSATQAVLKKQGLGFIEYAIKGDNRLMIAAEAISFGSWLSFYLAVLNNREPAGVPWVDFFKAELAK